MLAWVGYSTRPEQLAHISTPSASKNCSYLQNSNLSTSRLLAVVASSMPSTVTTRQDAATYPSRIPALFNFKPRRCHRGVHRLGASAPRCETALFPASASMTVVRSSTTARRWPRIPRHEPQLADTLTVGHQHWSG